MNGSPEHSGIDTIQSSLQERAGVAELNAMTPEAREMLTVVDAVKGAAIDYATSPAFLARSIRPREGIHGEAVLPHSIRPHLQRGTIPAIERRAVVPSGYRRDMVVSVTTYPDEAEWGRLNEFQGYADQFDPTTGDGVGVPRMQQQARQAWQRSGLETPDEHKAAVVSIGYAQSAESYHLNGTVEHHGADGTVSTLEGDDFDPVAGIIDEKAFADAAMALRRLDDGR